MMENDSPGKIIVRVASSSDSRKTNTTVPMSAFVIFFISSSSFISRLRHCFVGQRAAPLKRSSKSLRKEVSPAAFGVILDLTKDLESQSEVKVQSLKREGIQVKTDTLPLLGLLFC